MICPYLWNETEIQVNEKGKQENYEYEDVDGETKKLSVITNDISIMKNKYPFDCLKEGCACFSDGKCSRH